MPGIIVGVDGSGHSRRALEWAINEAAIRHAPLTVLTVQQVMTSFWAGPALYPQDTELAGMPARQSRTRPTRRSASSPPTPGRRR